MKNENSCLLAYMCFLRCIVEITILVPRITVFLLSNERKPFGILNAVSDKFSYFKLAAKKIRAKFVATTVIYTSLCLHLYFFFQPTFNLHEFVFYISL